MTIKQEPVFKQECIIKEEIKEEAPLIFPSNSEAAQNEALESAIYEVFFEEKAQQFKELTKSMEVLQKKIHLRTENIEKVLLELTTIKLFDTNAEESAEAWKLQLRLGLLSLDRINLEQERDEIEDKLYELLQAPDKNPGDIEKEETQEDEPVINKSLVPNRIRKKSTTKQQSGHNELSAKKVNIEKIKKSKSLQYNKGSAKISAPKRTAKKRKSSEADEFIITDDISSENKANLMPKRRRKNNL
ncbi:Oidioi.mRNA.OKI2018_I69.chr1.g1990.t1.cds [Oikopleura dioica]|uniref:Oidioi.mRNA.OKI2018_I69.chr1.g1990.t1.cds n=1 Tax=Oikopleura dioica TaxID=34765 RepID=A0ABN7SQ83_OIKDI|nr:Oidioi.mRNA.OKI2018_I69.chr1.g1990.t1.cds [Oikopleura dioica]